MDQEIEKISKKLMKELDEDRYRHTQGDNVYFSSTGNALWRRFEKGLTCRTFT